MSLGLSSVDGIFSSAAIMQAQEIPNQRLLGVVDDSTDPVTVTYYYSGATQKTGGLLLSNGNFANPIPQGGSGGGDMLKSIYDPLNVNSNCFARSNHTGTQAISTVVNLQTELDSKEEGLGNPPVDGYVLSSTAAGIRSWIAQSGGGGGTNLGYTASPTNGTVTSDTGTDATIPAGSETNASLMLPADKTKLNGIGAGAQLVSVQAGTNVTVDNTDPQNPIISASGGGSSGGKSLPYTLSGVGLEDVGVGGRRGTSIIFHIPVSLDAVPSSVTMSGTLRGSFYRNDTNNVGTQNFSMDTDVTYNSANSTKDLLEFSATVTDISWTAWGRITGNGTAWSITLNA